MFHKNGNAIGISIFFKNLSNSVTKAELLLTSVLSN